MQSALAWKIGLGGVTLAVLVAAGCNRDGRDFGRGIAGPAAGIAEGSRITGTIAQVAVLMRPNGEKMEQRMAGTAVSATVRDGVARPESLVSLARTTSMREERRILTLTDGEGRSHEVAVERGNSDGPPTALRHVVDGKLMMHMQFRWEARPGGWLLSHREVTLFENNQPVLRHQIEVGGAEVADAGRAGSLPLALVNRAGRTLLPAELEAAQLQCLDELVAFAAAALTTYIAYEALKLTPISLTSWRNFLGAVVLLGATTENLMDCLVSG